MVYVQALGSRSGPAFRCLELAETPEVQLLLSPSILAEIQDVLARPLLRARLRELTEERVAELLAKLRVCAELIPEPARDFSLPRDAKDEPYLNLAIAGRAKYLVSWNERHLGYLMRADTPEGREFCARFPGLRIVTPVEFLQAVRASGSTPKHDI
jgi:putative PIN family toxin of toxin-antitoxin system